MATSRGAKHFGGKGGKLRRPLQATHDLHVSTVYLWFLEQQPDLASAWASEDLIAPTRRGQKLPDAMIQDEAGNPLRVIEFAGAYPPERIEKLHLDCEYRGLPYELW